MTEESVQERKRNPETDSETRHSELCDIFVAVTGSEEFTETQKQEEPTRYLVAEDSLSDPVTAIAKDDGLGDTFSDLEYESN